VGGGRVRGESGRLAELAKAEERLLAFWLRRLGVAVLISYGVTAAAAAGLLSAVESTSLCSEEKSRKNKLMDGGR
jgi:hypothetical protein